MLLLAGAGAEPRRPVPKFEGQAIPDPPEQRAPWTPPATKLPRFLIESTTALFDAGMADPRGCEYRDIEIGNEFRMKTRGFVLPDRPEQGGRFAISWDGIIYPAVVGPAADLDADVRLVADLLGKNRAEMLKRGHRTIGLVGFYPASGYDTEFLEAGRPARVASLTPLKLCLLLRLGRVDLAEQLFEAGSSAPPRPDLTDKWISLVTLADERAAVLHARLVDAHRRGDDVVALDAARRLDAFARSISAKAKALGFARRDSPPYGSQPPVYFGPWPQLDLLLADQERRAAEPPRGPTPPPGGDPSTRIAARIRGFDQIGARQRPGPDPPRPATDPLVAELVAEGKPAVGPLLDALDSDARLTRCVTVNQRGGPAYVDPVVEAISSALFRIIKPGPGFQGGRGLNSGTTPEERRRLAAALREEWAKYRDVSPTERIYRTLNDNAAGPQLWLEAALSLIQTADGVDPAQPISPRPLRGEPLRDRRDPSVSELLARRAEQRAGQEHGLSDACSLASILHVWDKPAGLPLLKKYMSASIKSARDPDRARFNSPDDAKFIARGTLDRASAGDLAALDEYAAWVTTATPSSRTWDSFNILEPMWRFPDHPAIVEASRAIFLDPKSPWSPLAMKDQGDRLTGFHDPLASPLACIAAFREATLTLLADKTPAGTATREVDQIKYALNSGVSGSYGHYRTIALDERVGVAVPIRICDLAAWRLAGLDGAPEAGLTRDEAHRDRSVAACVAYLRRYGRHLSPLRPSNEPDFPFSQAHLRFPTLGRPATAEDLRENRAIFALEGEGEVRTVPTPQEFPILARWTALKDFPIDRPVGGPATRREYLQEGWVWQAEEVRRGDRWERFYGFAGHATIARVPASEVEFPRHRYGVANLPGGLDAQFAIAESPENGHEPGRPIVATMIIRNGSGMDRAVPTEFIRPAVDGQPALRRGIDLAVTPMSANGMDARGVEIAPARTARFDPGPATRTLAPTATFEAMAIDLHLWFPGLRPGPYRLRVDFGEDSGLGTGQTFLPFAIRDPGDGAG